VVPGSKKPPKKKIHNGLRAALNAVILPGMLYRPAFQGILLRNYTIKKEGIFLANYRIFTIVKIHMSDL